MKLSIELIHTRKLHYGNHFINVEKEQTLQGTSEVTGHTAQMCFYQDSLVQVALKRLCQERYATVQSFAISCVSSQVQLHYSVNWCDRRS